MLKQVVLVLCLLFSLYKTTEGLQCYACTYKSDDVNSACVDNPGNVPTGQPIVKCDKQYCTIQRQEYKDPEDQVASFFRGCEDNPPKMNTMDEDDNYKTYYQACKEDLCNGGSGKDSSSGTITGNDDGVGVLYVPGIAAGVVHIPSAFTIVGLIFGYILLR